MRLTVDVLICMHVKRLLLAIRVKSVIFARKIISLRVMLLFYEQSFYFKSNASIVGIK